MSDKFTAIAQIVSAIISKGEHPLPVPQTKPTGTTSSAAFNPAASGASPFPSQQGFLMRLEDGKICFFDSKENKITLEELINYVSRYLR